jgi:hypothetical protein
MALLSADIEDCVENKLKETNVKRLVLGNCVLLCLVLTLSPSAQAQVIQISNVEELYSAVNDTANVGTTLILSPGTYILSASDPNGILRPKGGRIELQLDMSLMGVEGDRDAVVISAINLPASSFPTKMNGLATGPNAAVRMGRGHNALEWLTVRDAVNGQANIDAGLQVPDAAGAFIRVEHVASTGSTRGLNVNTFGTQWSYKTLEADINDSYFFDNVSEGVRMGTLQGAQGAMINVRMSGNSSWGQQTGRLIENNGNMDGTVNVLSSGNQTYGNGAGTIVIDALSSGDARADGNTVNFEAHGDRFVGNTGFTPLDSGGLFVLGTENISPNSGGGSNNTVNISLWGCRMLDNTGTDLTAIAARSVPGTTASLSQNNHVTIEIHGEGNGNGRWQPVEFFADSLPAVPDEGNWVTVHE